MMSQKPEQVFGTSAEAVRNNRSTDNRETYDDRLNHILEAATQVIARVGYGTASMRAVAKEAGVSLAGIYHYFDSKERMLFLIQFRTFNSLVANLREKLHGVEEPQEQLRVMIRSHMDYFASNIAALKVCSHELDSLAGTSYEKARRIRHDYYEEVRAIIDRLLDARAPRCTLDRHVAVMSLFGTLNWLYRWYDPKRGRSPHTIANQIFAQFINGVFGANRSEETA